MLETWLRASGELGVGVFVPLLEAPKLALPIDLVKVSAGFPSPAADYEDKRLDINDYLIRNPVSTFFFPVEGDSMQGAEIFDGEPPRLPWRPFGLSQAGITARLASCR